MDKIPYRIPEYHKMVWRKAKAETELYFRDAWAWIGGAIVGVVSGFISTHLQNLWSKVTIIPLWVSAVTIFAGTILGLAAFVIVLWGWNGVWFIPARLYRARETAAWLNTWNDIEVKRFTFPKSYGNAVGLELISDKNTFNGTEISIQIGEIKISEFSTGMRKEEPEKDLHLLATDLGRFLPTNTIQNRREQKNKENWIKHVVVLIAEWDNNQAWIATKDDQKEYFLEVDKPYRIIVNFGNWTTNDNKVIKSGCAVWCDLIYKNNEEGNMEVEMAIARRSPEYAYEKQSK